MSQEAHLNGMTVSEIQQLESDLYHERSNHAITGERLIEAEALLKKSLARINHCRGRLRNLSVQIPDFEFDDTGMYSKISKEITEFLKP